MTILYEHSERQARTLAPLLGPDVTVVGAPAALVRRLTADPSEILVVFGPGTGLDEAADFAQQCRTHRPRLGVLLLRDRLDSAVLAQARHCGLREVAPAGDAAAVLAACARVRRPTMTATVSPPADPPVLAGPTPPNGAAMPVAFGTPGAIAAPDAPHPASVPGMPAARPVTYVEPEVAIAVAQVEPSVGSALAPRHSFTSAPADGDGGGGKVVAVFSGKGGAGKSMVATNLASILADRASVCLIDLDLTFGDIGIMLQLTPDRTIADAVPMAGRLDRTGLRTLLTAYRPNLDVLLAPVAPAVAEQVGRELVATVVALAREIFDYVVVDCASQFSEPVLAVLDAAHFHVLVTTPELPALKGLRVTLDMFDLLGYGNEGRLIVLNRAGSRVGLSTGDAEKVLRAPITAQVPSSRDVPLSVNKGVPIVDQRPRHPVSAALRGLAGKHLASGAPTRARGRRRSARGAGRGGR